ncbi:hypothetical protein HYFRA_00011823 [Hymenoscyphus fraxineus]|uniref:Tetraspanin Tsp3 n=1 Tax=Hymenoscyphus fraxineus TaxID=746836 RepID=A0A9N9L290_9HELO|nr:hypothetical protein HYFRA_00011823 [Hymenoscyphus fraxineus]
MTHIVKFFLWGGPLLLFILTAIAGYSYSQIRYLHLPISQALALFTLVLPIITGISMQGVYGLIQRASKTEQYQLTIPLVAVICFQLIYETVVATLALTYMIPPSTLQCGLEERWRSLFASKDESTIKRIQDSFKCCGFNSVKDRAFPFGEPSRCSEIFKRTAHCSGPMRKSQQIQAGLLLLVAVMVFVVKLISIVSLFSATEWTNAKWIRPIKRLANRSSNDRSDRQTTTRRLLEDNAAGEPYRDNPEEVGSPSVTGNVDPGARVQPSALGGHNEWRDEERG